MKIWAYKVIWLAVLLVFSGLGCESSSPGPVSHGDVAAPAMSLAYLNGSREKLSDLKGKVVLLNFWATWCPPCLEELPHFEALHRDYKDKGLSVIGVSMDQAGDDYVRSFVKDRGITYPIAMGAFEKMEKIWGALESVPTVHGFGSEKPAFANGSVQMMPTSFVIDRTGHIYRKHVGPRDRETLEPELRLLLGMEESLAQAQ